MLLDTVLFLSFSHGHVELCNSSFFPLTWFYMLAYCVGHDSVAKLTGLGTHTGFGEQEL